MNIAIIGCSGMGRVHADAIQRAGLRVLLCADKSRKAATALAKECGAKVAASPEKAVTDKRVDAVLIATPTPFHLEYIIMAAKAGKNIFCEKPFCRTVEECKKAIAAANKAKVKLFVGHVVRYFHEFECIKSQVADGKIGEPGFVKISRGGIFPGGPKSWFANYRMSGGVTLDCMIHDLDWVRYAFGEPERIFCRALMRTRPQPMDYSQVTMRTKSGVIATVIGTWGASGRLSREGGSLREQGHAAVRQLGCAYSRDDPRRVGQSRHDCSRESRQ